MGKNSLEDAAAVWVHRTPHSCMRLSKSSMNGPDTIVPGSSSRGSSNSDADGGGGGSGGDVIGRNMTIPPSVRYYSCNDEVEVGGVGWLLFHLLSLHFAHADRGEWLKRQGRGREGRIKTNPLCERVLVAMATIITSHLGEQERGEKGGGVGRRWRRVEKGREERRDRGGLGRHGGRMLLRENVEKRNVRSQEVGTNVKEKREEKV